MIPAAEGPPVVVIEPHRQVADALQDVVTLADCVPVMASHCESVTDADVAEAERLECQVIARAPNPVQAYGALTQLALRSPQGAASQ